MSNTEIQPVTATPVPAMASAAPQHGILHLPIEEMQQKLDEYAQRRLTFRKWLLAQMRSGVHYGTPPGCEVKLNDKGEIITWDGKVVRRDQWRAKPSLYKAGAELLIDLLQMRDEYEVKYQQVQDIQSRKEGIKTVEAWLVKCVLRNRASGDILGEGNGVFAIGEKGMGANSAIKIAQKRAKVDAVINALGLSDLFTQDIEEGEKQPNPAPDVDPTAPTAPTRAERQEPTIAQRFAALKRAYAAKYGKDKAAFVKWCGNTLMASGEWASAEAWNENDIRICMEALR